MPTIRRTDPPPGPKEVAVIVRAGMRGVVSLPVALSLPLEVPHRDLLIFLSFAAILVTPVVRA